MSNSKDVESMKNWFLPLVILVLVVLLAGCSGNSQSKDTELGGQSASSETGDDIYKKSCATCHGGELEGVSGPSLVSIGDKYSQEDIKDIINNGKGNMFPVNLPADEIDALVDWLTEKQ